MGNQVDNVIKDIVTKTKEVEKKINDLKFKYKHVFDEMDTLLAQMDELERAKSEVKAMLIEAEDFDLHKVGTVKVSVCPITKLEVEDIDKVDDKYKSTEVVADVKKAQEVKKLLGEVPEGFKDKTYHRFTWKDTGKDA